VTSLSDKARRGTRHSADRAEAKREGLAFSFFSEMPKRFRQDMDLKGVDLRKNLDLIRRGKKAGSRKGECIMEAVFRVPAKRREAAAYAPRSSHKSPCDSCEPRSTEPQLRLKS